MKTMANKITATIAPVVAIVLLGGSASVGLAQNSPVGTWDVVLSGTQRGVAQITFASDMTLSGFEIIAPRSTKTPGTGGEEDPRNPTGDDGRTPPINEEFTTPTNFFGAAPLQGTWSFDSRLRVVGVMNELSSSITNGVSFTATVRPGVRITMNGLRFGKKTTYRGVPLTALTDQSGDYYGIGSRAGQGFNELFTLTPSTDPNSYDVAGVGPAYNFVGAILVSRQNQMGFFTITDETTNGVIRAIIGSYNPNKGAGTLIGINEIPGSLSTHNVKMKVNRQGGP